MELHAKANLLYDKLGTYKKLINILILSGNINLPVIII